MDKNIKKKVIQHKFNWGLQDPAGKIRASFCYKIAASNMKSYLEEKFQVKLKLVSLNKPIRNTKGL